MHYSEASQTAVAKNNKDCVRASLDVLKMTEHPRQPGVHLREKQHRLFVPHLFFIIRISKRDL